MADPTADTDAYGSPPRAKTRDPNVGRRVGPYLLVRLVGEGGMGSVYAAQRADEQFHKLAAVKLVRESALSEESLHRFLNERQALAELDHPNIARLLDGGTTSDGRPYFVMEFVEGERIDRYCNRRQLPIPERLRLFRDVCSAVQYAHQNLIVHRDLKPSNILVTATGAVKLLDFGIAKLLKRPDDPEDPDITQTAGGPMTPENASPEQVRGEAITTATDVYALGVLLYLLLTGRHPFARHMASIFALRYAIMTETPEDPSHAVKLVTPDFVKGETPDKLSRRLRGDLDTIVQTALRKEPHRRYASVERFSEDIARHLAALPVSARKDTFRYRAGKFVRRHTAGVGAAAVIAAALIASSAVAIRSAGIAERERASADRRFNEVRQLAHFVLFNLDDAIRAGPTSARRTVVAEGLKYLSRLEKDSGGDPSLSRELAAAYLKIGDLQGNLYLANIGNQAAARRSYESAQRIAAALGAKHPGDLEAAREAAEASVKIANLLSLGADRDEALRRYDAAKSVFEKLAPRYPPARHDLMDVWAKIGFAHLQVGDPRGALAAYRQCLEIARQIAASDPSVPARRALAYGNERVGYAMARSGSTAEGLTKLRSALAEYQALVLASPDRAAAERDIESTLAIVGDVLAESGKLTGAVDSYRKALTVSEALSASDPKNEQFQRDRIVMLGRLADALSKSGDAPEAHAVARNAIALLQPLAQAPHASDPDLVQYCVLLLSLRDRSYASEALAIAQELVAHTHGKDPVMLDLLAQAWYLSGNRERAIAAERNALAILGPDSGSDMAARARTHLAGFGAPSPQQQPNQPRSSQ